MKHLLLLGLLFSSSLIVSQETDKINQSFWDNFTLRKSFTSANSKAKAAVITYTNPKDKKESWLLNAALGLNILTPKKEIIALSPYIEYHRNTLVDEEQNNWQTGLALEWQTRDLVLKKWSPILIGSTKYNQDIKNEVNSLQGNLYATAIFKGYNLDYKHFYIPNNIVNFGKLFQFVYTPYVGLENENRLKTETISEEGNIYRAYLRVTSSIVLFPISEKWCDKIELVTDWQYRYNFSENVDELTTEDHNYFSAGMNYIFFTTENGSKSAKIGVDYVHGENPSKNFEDQSYYAITLKVKF